MGRQAGDNSLGHLDHSWRQMKVEKEDESERDNELTRLDCMIRGRAWMVGAGLMLGA